MTNDQDTIAAIQTALLAGDLALAGNLAADLAQLGEVCLWCGAASIGCRIAPAASFGQALNPLAGYLCTTCFGSARTRQLFHEFRPLVVDEAARREAARRMAERARTMGALLANSPEDTTPTPRTIDDDG